MSVFGDVVDGVQDISNSIAGVLPQSFLGKENTNRALSAAAWRLAGTLDQTARRTYILDGFANKDNTKPNVRRVTTHTPEMIVLIKKSMFNSLSDNYRSEFMDKEEKHFIRAAKKLFENKCAEISAYEQLTKLNNIIRETGVVTSPVVRMIYDTINKLDTNSLFSGFSGDASDNFLSSSLNSYTKFIGENKDGVATLRQALRLNGFSPTTNWITDKTFEKADSLGAGTGVIEFTMVDRFDCTVSVKLGQGGGNLSLLSPNRLLLITEDDIEKAIYQSANTKFSIIDTLTMELESQNEQDLQDLNHSRLARGASVVTVLTNLRTRIYNKITVILEKVGIELTSSAGTGLDYDKIIHNPDVPDYEQFTQDEMDLLNRLYANMFKVIKGKIQQFSDFRNYNFESNHVRKLMYLQFKGRQLIQSMDSVTVFIDSKRVDDEMLSSIVNNSLNPDLAYSAATGSQSTNFTQNASSFFGTSNFLQAADALLGDENFSREEAEKNILAGPDFPMWLYSELRSVFTSENLGTCVFSGVVESAKENYSNDGSYVVTATLKDNSFYFDQSLINTKPGLDQFNGYLYDPVTPFDFEFDSATGLLPSVSKFKLLEENEKFIASNLFKFQDGKYAGQKMTIDKFKNPDIEPTEALTKLTGTYSETSKKIFDAPDGFVYRWKKGIGSAIINQSGTNDGVIGSQLLSNKLALVNVTDPFSGQDVVNMISILITGEPYNFNTFMKSAIRMGTTNIDGGFSPDTDYFAGLSRIIKKQNKVWGNFIPFKKMTTDPNLFAQAMALQTMALSHSTLIKKKQNQRVQLLNKLMQFEGDTFQFDINKYDINLSHPGATLKINTSDQMVSYPIIKKIVQLGAEIQLHEESIRYSLDSSEIKKSLLMIGSNVLFDDMNILSKKELDKNFETLVHNQNAITQRRLWQVKANVDNNLFIVDSEYDTDYDIQVIAQQLTSNNFDVVNMAWSKVSAKLTNAIKTIGMELFANSQGHIELRVPKYNRMPSSVLFEMIKKKREHGVQIFPDFIEKSFKNRVEATFNEIEILEDQIRLYCVALGAQYPAKTGDDPDSQISSLLKGGLAFKGYNRNEFFFTTDQDGTLLSIRKAVGSITDADHSQQNNSTTIIPGFLSVENSTDPFFERSFGNDETTQKYVKTFSRAANTYNNFDILKQNKNFKDIYTKFAANNASFLNDQVDGANKIRPRLARKLGVSTDSPMIKTISQLLPNSKNGKISPIDINSIQNKLDGLLSSRHEAMITAVNLIKSLDEAARFNSDNTEILSKLLMPNLYGRKDIPTFLKGMIEDENVDDFGPGSAKRYIIKESDILSMTYSENPPNFTQVEVSGAELGGLVGGQGFPIGGSNDFKMANVWSVDYDLWRKYGYKESETAYVPFLNNPELQLAPYALFLLNRERKNILRANITMIGDEYKQPGEVYYVEDMGMLFYSETITHNFSYGEDFTTTMTLNYGHVPGEYIPTPLDVIGKNLYKGTNTNVGNYYVSRSGTTASDKGDALGVIHFPNYRKSGTPSSKTNLSVAQEILDGSIGEQNKKTINDILGKATFLLEANIPQENRGYRALTVRIYHLSGDIDTRLEDAAKQVISKLVSKGIPKSKIVGRRVGSDTLVAGEPFFIDLNSEEGARNPSNAVISMSKEFETSSDSIPSISSTLANLIPVDANFFILYNAIDVWFESSITPTTEILNMLDSPAKNTSTNYSTGTNPKTTISDNRLDGMRKFYNSLNTNFKSNVTVTTVTKTQ